MTGDLGIRRAIQTAFANAQLPASAQYGIAQVKVTNSEPGAEDIYSFLSAYTKAALSAKPGS